MRKIVYLQIFATMVIAVFSALLGGESAAVSALLSGFACALPNAIFAANLGIFLKISPKSAPVIFLIGEFIKIIAIALLLCLVVVLYEDLIWPAVIVTMIVVLNCSFLGLLLTRE